MRTAQSHLCFTPNSDRKSGHFSCPGRTGLKEKEAGSACRVRLGWLRFSEVVSRLQRRKAKN